MKARLRPFFEHSFFLWEEKGKETALEGDWVREKLKKQEYNLMKQAILRERVNLELAVPPEVGV